MARAAGAASHLWSRRSRRRTSCRREAAAADAAASRPSSSSCSSSSSRQRRGRRGAAPRHRPPRRRSATTPRRVRGCRRRAMSTGVSRRATAWGHWTTWLRRVPLPPAACDGWILVIWSVCVCWCWHMYVCNRSAWRTNQRLMQCKERTEPKECQARNLLGKICRLRNAGSATCVCNRRTKNELVAGQGTSVVTRRRKAAAQPRWRRRPRLGRRDLRSPRPGSEPPTYACLPPMQEPTKTCYSRTYGSRRTGNTGSSQVPLPGPKEVLSCFLTWRADKLAKGSNYSFWTLAGGQ